MRYEDRDVYEELFKIGLTEEEIDKQFEINVDLKVVLGTDIKQEIEFLKQYNLTEEDIAEISRKNPWILTEDFQRMRFLEKYYGEVDIKDLGELLKKQSISMSVNPKEVKDFIDKLTEEGKSKEEVRNIILDRRNV